MAERLVAAEEAIYVDAADGLVNWDEHTLQTALSAVFPDEAGAGRVSMERIDTDTDLRITDAHIRRWFGPALGARKSYAERLAEGMQPVGGGAGRELDKGAAAESDGGLAAAYGVDTGDWPVEPLEVLGPAPIILDLRRLGAAKGKYFRRCMQLFSLSRSLVIGKHCKQ